MDPVLGGAIVSGIAAVIIAWINARSNTEKASLIADKASLTAENRRLRKWVKDNGGDPDDLI